MRVTKEPEERRQEIIDTAMRLFYEKGYEKTSIADIAKAIGVAQGLCYRYFPSKEALFDSTVDQYAQILAGRLTPPEESLRGHLRKFWNRCPWTRRPTTPCTTGCSMRPTTKNSTTSSP